MKTIINVSNRLPITIGKTVKRSSGGLVSALDGAMDPFQLKWVGWAGGDIQSEHERAELKKRIENEFHYTPIFLTQADIDAYYNGFSNASLWPLLHYMTPLSRYAEGWFEAYERVNRIFGDAILDMAADDDIIWVHDYHLMLLPGILREKNKHLKVGFFLHTPFPSYEIFRCHPKREALVEGLLGADLIGFHTFGYLRHFRSTVLRILGMESEITHINHDGFRTSLGVYPIGINSRRFVEELESTDHEKSMKEYQAVYRGKKIVLGVERLDYTKGILQRLNAIEAYLDTDRNNENIVFILISIPSRESVEAYQKLVDEVQGRVSQINGKLSTLKNVPVYFIHQSVTFSHLCALYRLADICMVTPLIDGMNLVAKEFLACQIDYKGVLILSEFAGAAQELSNALIINPYDSGQMVESIKTALNLTDDEKHQMNRPMRERVLRYDAAFWSRSFLLDLIQERKTDGHSVEAKNITAENIPHLMEAEKIALFLDYDGTIADIKKRPMDARPDEAIKHLFKRLESCPCIDVYMISGRKKRDMDRFFSMYHFFLIAEHGYFYKSYGDDTWTLFDDKADLNWMEKIIEIFQHYSGMTPGSFVEVKRSSVVWHYRRSDPEFGAWKAVQLVAELSEMLTNLPVEIHHGKKIVEVSSIQVNKGIALEYFLSKKKYDVVLCAGDDETDESMFRIAKEDIISVKVGDKDTLASYKIATPGIFRSFLNDIVTILNERGKDVDTLTQ